MKSRLSRLLVIGILLCSYALEAQDTTFLGRAYKLTMDKSLATSYEIITYDTDNDSTAVSNEYFMNHQLKRTTSYSNFKKNIRHGWDSLFFADGSLRSAVTFNKNGMDGMHIIYHPNGQVKRKDFYTADKLDSGKCFAFDGSDTAYYPYETMPSFPGGDNALIRFLIQSVKFPVEAKEKNIHGEVIITFVIDTDGQIVEIQTKQSVHPILDNEVIRVIKSMPRWVAGTQDGVAVRVQYNLPFRFRIR